MSGNCSATLITESPKPKLVAKISVQPCWAQFAQHALAIRAFRHVSRHKRFSTASAELFFEIEPALVYGHSSSHCR
jgi:hypothetical protein